MIKEMIPSLLRYMLAGLSAWLTSELTRYGFNASDAMDLAEAAVAFISAAILLFWSGAKNKKNANLKKDLNLTLPKKGQHYENVND